MSMNEIRMTTYKDAVAVELENEFLRVIVIPNSGAKIASIFYKPSGVEILEQHPSEEFQWSQYGDQFETGECAGFDEMFPTIDRCESQQYPWEGIEYPDHGELWAIPWEYQIRDNGLMLHAHGVRLAYQLEKVVRLEGESLKIHYRLNNLSAFDFDYIWAAHPLFAAGEGMKIEVPGEGHKVINSSQNPVLGSSEALYDFPLAQLPDGSTRDLATIHPRDGHSYTKFYFSRALTEGWCALVDPMRRMRVRMDFPVEKIPYLGVWINEGGVNDQYVVALEPSSGGMDDPIRARAQGMFSNLKARSGRSWSLKLSVEQF